MTPTVAAELAMTASFAACLVGAWLFVVPWVRTVGAERALPPLLGVHTGRHIALQLVSAQSAGFPISDVGRDQIMYGDLAGMMLALLALVAVVRSWRGWRLIVWVFVAETVLDLANALIVGLREELFASAQNVSWLILTFYVPVLWVTVALVGWILVARK